VRIGPAITVISLIRSTVTIVKALTTVPVVVVGEYCQDNCRSPGSWS
jgi:hypothetical protein